MRKIGQDQIEALARRLRDPMPEVKPRLVVLHFEQRGPAIIARQGDDIMWNCLAPSVTAARAIVTALRELQRTRGTIMDKKGS